MRSKGQNFMPDFLGSIVVFGFLLTIFAFAVQTMNSPGSFERADSLRRDAYYTTTLMVTSPGYPGDWNSTNVKIPGFATDDHLIQYSKLEEFDKLSYSEQKSLLGSPEFRLEFRENGSTVSVSGNNLSYGKTPEKASTVIPVTRNVLLNDTSKTLDAKMEYVVWR